MAQPIDPYRTLGLAPGASLDEIRRAYRKLAKANHPDSAGEPALPRFLAIQAAYETLIEGRTRPPGRPGHAPRTPGQPARRSEPWRADPGRERAARDASARSRRGGSGTADPSGPAGASGTAGASRTAGPAGTTAGAGEPADQATSSTGSGAGSRNDRSRRGGRPRPPKATLGSTSYDAAEDEPFEPDWSGGTWYGASSGTYWTINPKEYADPRKHGPEYQRRARRRIDGVEYDPADDDPELSGDDFAGQESETATGSERRRFDGRWAYPDEGGSVPGGEAGAGEADWRSEQEVPTAQRRPTIGETADRLLAGNVGLVGRLVMAFVGWAPIGALVGWTAGEISGCGRFTASCIDPGGVWMIVPNVVVIVLLVALPQLAALSAAGAIGSILVSVPAAVVLSAAGGARQPEVATAIINVAAAVGYVAGAAFATGRRLGWRRVP